MNNIVLIDLFCVMCNKVYMFYIFIVAIIFILTAFMYGHDLELLRVLVKLVVQEEGSNTYRLNL